MMMHPLTCVHGLSREMLLPMEAVLLPRPPPDPAPIVVSSSLSSPTQTALPPSENDESEGGELFAFACGSLVVLIVRVLS